MVNFLTLKIVQKNQINLYEMSITEPDASTDEEMRIAFLIIGTSYDQKNKIKHV
jgi:hypothetical protein